ncbi:MAG: DUF4212 domain-containing protein [Deltaproteobacteria bacterium]|nr:DUF4212 domain-containing protein [Deltaproteobacteria bacterium]
MVAGKAEEGGAGARAYWRANLRVMGVLLGIWFVASYGLGILLVEPLNRLQFFGFPLGFWMAQQGSIYIFVLLIFAYALWMDRLDRRYGVALEADSEAQEAGGDSG